MKALRSVKGRLSVSVAAGTAIAVAVLGLPGASASGTAGSVEGAERPQTETAQVQRTAAAPGSLVSKVRGEFGRQGKVRGQFDPDRFFVKRGETYANGILHARLIRGNGNVVGSVDKRVTLPVKRGSVPQATAAQAGGACDILHLVLGPLDLDLLGLEVHLNRVVLDIIARSGAGNLLGNLLCAVAGLLDNTGLLGQLRLSNLLNRILGVLRV